MTESLVISRTEKASRLMVTLKYFPKKDWSTIKRTVS